MATSRIYRVKRRRRVNYFTYEDYGKVCQSIIWVQQVPGDLTRVNVKVPKNDFSRVAAIVLRVLDDNAVRYKRWGKYASDPTKLSIVFPNKSFAARAAGIIAKMSTPDSIDPANVSLETGACVTNNGIMTRVDLEQQDDGTNKPKKGSTYTPSSAPASTVATDETSGLSRWLLIGGAAVFAILLVVAIIKMRKKK